MHYALKGKRVFVAGHRGMVGSAICRRLALEDVELVTAARTELDLRDADAVSAWMATARPDVVVIAAAKVGGIQANNTYPVDFLQDNLMIQNAVIAGAHAADADRLLFLGSSCIYPKLAPQPIVEDALLTGLLEPTNEPYAIAKIAGIKLVEAYRRQYGRDWISAMPTNLYGPGDNYHPENSHVLPALLRRFHEAKINGDKEVVVWGSGTPLREFMHADDLADALTYLLKFYSAEEHINVGSGHEVSISKLATMIADVVDYRPSIQFDTAKDDGTPRKRMDCSKLNRLGWDKCRTLEAGISQAYQSFLREIL